MKPTLNYGNKLLTANLILAALFLLVAGPGYAQSGLLVVAHGAGPEWNEPVRRTVAQVSWSRGPTEVAFLMGPEAETSGWDSAVTRLVRSGARDIVVVPLMVSSFGEHVEQIRWLAGEIAQLPAGLETHQHHGRLPIPVPVRVARALDDAPELGAALAERWSALSGTDRARPILLVAHGPSADTLAVHWIRNLTAVGEALTRSGAPVVRVALLRDDAPPQVRGAAVAAMRDAVRALVAHGADSVVALPVMISSGVITAVRIPRDLADLPVRYVSLPLAPLPPLARWIERSAAAALILGAR